MLPPELREPQIPVGSYKRASVEPIVRSNFIYVWTCANQTGNVGFDNKRNVRGRCVSPQFSEQRRREHNISDLIDAQNQDPARLLKDAHEAVRQAPKRYLNVAT